MSNQNESLKTIVNELVDIAHGIDRDADLNCRVNEWGTGEPYDIDLNYAFGAPSMIPDIPADKDKCWNISFVNVASRVTDMERIVYDILQIGIDTKFARQVMYGYNATYAGVLSSMILEQQKKGNIAFNTEEFNNFCEKWRYGPLGGTVCEHAERYKEILKIQEAAEAAADSADDFRERLSDELLSIPDDGYEFGFQIVHGADEDADIYAIWSHEQDAVTSKQLIISVPFESLSDPERFQKLFNEAFVNRFPYSSLGVMELDQSESCSPTC